MRAFFRAHIARQTSLDPAAAERLSDALTKAINRMLVWDMPAAPEQAPPQPSASQTAPPGKGRIKPAAVADAPSAAPAVTAFDPYAFSAMVVLAKTGKDGLLKRLADIKSVENLQAFAEAQHLGIAPNLKKADELRRAIVAATEQRLADRKAAAS